MSRHFREAPDDGLRAPEDFAAREYELDRAPEFLDGNLREPRTDFLVGRIVQAIAGKAFPPPDPEPAERAVAVEDEERPLRRVRDAPAGQEGPSVAARTRRISAANRAGSSRNGKCEEFSNQTSSLRGASTLATYSETRADGDV